MAYAEYWAVDTYEDNNSSCIMQPYSATFHPFGNVFFSLFFPFSNFKLFIHCVTFFFKISSTMQYFSVCGKVYQMNEKLQKSCIIGKKIVD